MGKRGPARLPTNVVKLRNKAGHTRPINELEPQFHGETQIPEQVQKNSIALQEWQRRAPELEELGLLNGQFQNEFADYCLQWAYYLQLQERIEKIGLQKAIEKGVWRSFQNASMQRLRLAARFGFTPADASSVKIKPPETKQGAKRFMA